MGSRWPVRETINSTYFAVGRDVATPMRRFSDFCRLQSIIFSFRELRLRAARLATSLQGAGGNDPPRNKKQESDWNATTCSNPPQTNGDFRTPRAVLVCC